MMNELLMDRPPPKNISEKRETMLTHCLSCLQIN